MYEVIGTSATRAFRVLWMLEELGVEYTHTPAGPRSAEVRKINPSGKIPAMRVGDKILTDSVAIMTFLGDSHGKLSYPAGTLPRAHQDGLTLQILDDLEALLWTAARHSFVLPEDQRVPEIKPALRNEYQVNIVRLEEAFTGPFLMGDMMTLTDILLTHCLRWAQTAQFPEPGTTLTAYRGRLEARPAFQKAVNLP